MPCDTTAGLWGDEVCGIGVYLEKHVVGNKPEVAAGVSSSVIEEAVAELKFFCCRICLLSRDRVESREQCAIDCSRVVVKERVEDTLDPCGELWG